VRDQRDCSTSHESIAEGSLPGALSSRQDVDSPRCWVRDGLPNLRREPAAEYLHNNNLDRAPPHDSTNRLTHLASPGPQLWCA
jgi:hypothetical protein